MRPNLSLENIAGALAVLGTGVIMAACGGDSKPAVNANEVSNATAPTDGSAHCGATATHKPGEASCSADKSGAAAATGGATDAKSADAMAAKPADTTPAAATPAAATPAAATTAATTTTPAPATTGTGKKPATPPAAAKKGGSGSCGAGTCGAKK